MLTIKRLVLIILTLSILLTGCGSGELIIEEGVREISLAVFSVDNLNPLTTKSDSVCEIMSFVYDSLFTFDKSLKAEPSLADGITLSPDGLTAKIALNKDAKWHSGADFTAEDVVYTIDTIKAFGKMYTDNVKDIVSATAEADGSVQIAFSSPQLNPEALFSFPIIRNGSSQEIESTPDGTGRFKFSDKTSNEIVLKNVSNENSIVRIHFLRNSYACLNAFESRETDILTSSTVDLYENTPAGEINIHEYTSNRMTFIGFNNRLPKYQEPYIKIAINCLVNRGKIIDESLLGKATESTLPINPTSWFYSLTDGPEMDVEGSMEKAGYKKINGRYMTENGEYASVTLLVSQNDQKKMSVAENIRKQLEAAGFEANTYLTDYNSYLNMIEKGDYDLFLGEVNMRDNLDPGFLTEQGNMFFYENAELSDALFKLRIARDDKSLIDACTEYERVFSVNPAFAPLYFAKDAIVTRNTLSGITEPNFYNSLKNPDMIYVSASSKKVNDNE